MHEPARTMMLWKGILLAWILIGPRLVLSLPVHPEPCDSKLAQNVNLDHPRKTFTAENWTVFRFLPNNSSLKVSVTQDSDDAAMNPRLTLFGVINGTCTFLQSGEAAGGHFLRVANRSRDSSRSTYYAVVACDTRCRYHVSFVIASAEDAQELPLGEKGFGVAFRGVPSHYLLRCVSACADKVHLAKNSRITFSVWPRDASSKHRLALLVKKDEEQEASDSDQLEASGGWFGGEVVSVAAGEGTYYLTVIMRHGATPLPFVIMARFLDDIQTLSAANPVFGAVSGSTVETFRFEVQKPDTDIEFYVTALDGDLSASVAFADVGGGYPTKELGAWLLTNQTDDLQIVIPPNAPKRLQHPTGWYHIGIYSEAPATFSLLALEEIHINQDNADGMLELFFIELYLGLPQASSVSPGQPRSFLHFFQMPSARIVITLEVLEGLPPDVCASSCRYDPHDCPMVSPFFLSAKTLPRNVVADCGAASARGGDSGGVVAMEARIEAPCLGCWYAIFISSAKGSSSFRLTLSGDSDNVHPLVIGKPFYGHVDAGEDGLDLAFSMPFDIAKARVEANSSLKVVLTVSYGDPLYAVLFGNRTHGIPLFNGSRTGRQEFDWLPYLVGDYIVHVWAASKHSSFRLQLSWESELPSEVSQKKRLATLFEGEVVRGVLLNGKPDFFHLKFLNASGRPDIEIQCTPLGNTAVRVYVFVVKDPSVALDEQLERFLRSPQAMNTWRSRPGAKLLRIEGIDREYLPPADALYAIAVVPAGNENSARIEYEVEVQVGDAVRELPTTGVTIADVLKSSQYLRYRIRVGEADRDVIVNLRMISGDSDLYFGMSSSVSRHQCELRSEEVGGDDTIVLRMNDPAMQKLRCTEERLKRLGECVYYVAVRGVTASSEFRLSASIQDGAPTPLTLFSKLEFAVPAGERQAFFIALHFPMRAQYLQLTLESGLMLGDAESIEDDASAKPAHTGLRVYVLPEGVARRPSQELLQNDTAEGNVSVSSFAGVWTVLFNESLLAPLCEIAMREAKEEEDCAALGVLTAGIEDLRATLQLLLADPKDSPGGGEASLVGSGAPLRGSVLQEGGVAAYTLPLGAEARNVEITVSLLSECRVSLRVELPDGSSPKPAETDFLPFAEVHFRADGNVSAAKVFVRHVSGTPPCEFDVRAMVEGEDAIGGVLEGALSAERLLLNEPLVRSCSDEPRLFTLTLRREALVTASTKITVSALAGRVEVEVSYLQTTGEGPDEGGDKGSRPSPVVLPCLSDDAEHRGLRSLTCPDPADHCAAGESCQVFIRVRGRNKRMADFVVAAQSFNEFERPWETLLPGVPVKGTVKAMKQGTRNSGELLYQVYVTNPASKLKVRLSPRGPGHEQLSKEVRLSADTRKNPDEPAYSSRSSRIDLVELVIDPTSSNELGRFHPPCVLYVRVQALISEVPFTISVEAEGDYELLSDGDDPVVIDLWPRQPEYFLFDSRRAKSMVTIVASPSRNSLDPFNEFIKMYILDCDMTGQDDTLPDPNATLITLEQLQDPTLKPSDQFFKYQGFRNARSQVIAILTRKSVHADDHCYYRVAVESLRMEKSILSIRGFESGRNVALPLGEPLQGLVVDGRSVSYALEVPPSFDVSDNVVLSLQVCSGKLRLRAGRSAEAPALVKPPPGGVFNYLVPFENARWLEVHPESSEPGSFILEAHDWRDQQWLEVGGLGPKLTVVPVGLGTVEVQWETARLQGVSQVFDSGTDRTIDYEVVYLLASQAEANLSTACGLYHEKRRRVARSVWAETRQTAPLTDLHVGSIYVINVIARSPTTGFSVAYIPYTHTVSAAVFDGSKVGSNPIVGEKEQWGLRWFFMLSVFVVFSLFSFRYLGNLCSGRRRPWSSPQLELPTWSRYAPASSFDAGDGYAAPRLVGSASGADYDRF